MLKFAYPSKFFNKYNVGVLIADEQILANAVAEGMGNLHTVNKIIEKLVITEQAFACRKKNTTDEDLDEQVNSNVTSPVKPPARPSSWNMGHQLRRLTSHFGGGALSSISPAAAQAPTDTIMQKQISIKDLIRAVKVRGTVLSDHVTNMKVSKSKKSQVIVNEPATDVRNEVFKPSAMTQSTTKVKAPIAPSKSINMIIYEGDENEDEASAVTGSTVSKEQNGAADDQSTSSYSGSSSGSSYSSCQSSGNEEEPTSRPHSNSAAIEFESDKYGWSNHKDELTGPAGLMKRGTLDEEDNRISDEGEIIGKVSLVNHIIVFGCKINLSIFMQELRRSLMVGGAYHPIIVVGEAFPTNWDRLRAKFKDIYFLRGKLTNST